MPAKENKDLITRYFKDSNASIGDAAKSSALMNNYIDPKWAFHFASGDMGFEQTKQFFISWWTAFPDLHFVIDDIVAEDDKVTVRSTWEGTHKGQYFGIAPTGKKVTQPGISIYRITGGKLIEMWSAFDQLGLMQQLGAIPA
jgi:predicted ester cyclase